MGDAGVQEVIDPKSQSPNGRSRALLLYGPTPDMKPETSTAWSVGADMMPRATPGLMLSVSYFNVDYQTRLRNRASMMTVIGSLQSPMLVDTNRAIPLQVAASCADVGLRVISEASCASWVRKSTELVPTLRILPIVRTGRETTSSIGQPAPPAQ